MIPIFPDDFVEQTHHMRENCALVSEWLKIPNSPILSPFKGLRQWIHTGVSNTTISVLGGPNWPNADGINTFECWVQSEENPVKNVTLDELNLYISTFNYEPDKTTL